MEYAQIILYPVAPIDASTLRHKNIILIVMEYVIISVLLAMENVMEIVLLIFVGWINVYHKALSLIIGIVTVNAYISLNHVMELVMLIQSLVELIAVSLMEIRIRFMNVVKNASITINLVMELVLLALLCVDQIYARPQQVFIGIVKANVPQKNLLAMATVPREELSVGLICAWNLDPWIGTMTVMASVPITINHVMEYVKWRVT